MTSGPDTLRAGVIGLGPVGAAVARRLVQSGRALAVHDPGGRAGGPDLPQPLRSAVEVAERSDVVILDTGGAVDREAVLSPGDLFEANREDLIVVACDEVTVAGPRHYAATGDPLLDCGVMALRGVDDVAGIASFGGERALFDRAAPLLRDAFGAVVHCGPLGAGSATGVACNLVAERSRVAWSDAERLVLRAGARPEALREMVTAAGVGVAAGTAANEAVVRRYFTCLDTEDWDTMRELWDPEGRLQAVGARARVGIEEVIGFFSKLFTPWPTHRDHPRRIIVAGDTVTVDVEFMGVTPDGRRVTFEAVDVFDLREQRIVRMSNWYDIAFARKALAPLTGSEGGR